MNDHIREFPISYKVIRGDITFSYMYNTCVRVNRGNQTRFVTIVANFFFCFASA